MKRKTLNTLFVEHVSVPLSGNPTCSTWYGMVPAYVLMDKRLKWIDRTIFGMIALGVPKNNHKADPVSVGARWIAESLGISHTSVNRSVQRLIDAGHVKRSGSRGQRTTYEFTSWVFRDVDKREGGEVRVTGASGVPIHAGTVPDPVPPVKSAPRKWREAQNAKATA